MIESDQTVAEPAMQVILAAMRQQDQNRPPLGAVPPPDMRARASAQFAAWNQEPPPLATVRDFEIPGGEGLRPARLYDPDSHTGAPLLLYLHGGGWVIGDLDLEDRALRLLAQESGSKIVSLDYRLAPEHPFPAAIEDTSAALEWLKQNGEALGAQRGKLALGGASAGANLALATALYQRDRGGALPDFLLLFYGVYGVDRNTESDRLFGGPDFGGALVHMETFYTLYAGPPEARRIPLVAPLLAKLSGLPPVYMNAAGLDPLRDDSRQLNARFKEAGVAVNFTEYPGVIHGFTQFSRTSETARRALAEAGAALKRALG